MVQKKKYFKLEIRIWRRLFLHFLTKGLMFMIFNVRSAIRIKRIQLGLCIAVVNYLMLIVFLIEVNWGSVITAINLLELKNHYYQLILLISKDWLNSNHQWTKLIISKLAITEWLILTSQWRLINLFKIKNFWGK